MGEVIIAILVFIAVIAITALLFGGWLVVMVCTAVGRLLMLPFRCPPGNAALVNVDATPAAPRCANERCRAENAPVAAYCRRCGSPVRAVQHVPVRRVAMW